MKKINKQNPLKYFNDQADARKKSVIEGNKKLIKAQMGVAQIPEQIQGFKEAKNIYQGPLDEDASKYANIYYPSTAGKNLASANPGNKSYSGTTKEMLDRSNMENKLRSLSQSSQRYYTDSPEDEAKLRGRTTYKKGGAVKVKKKK